MSRLAIIGTIEVVPGTRERLLTALAAHKARCLANEPGTLQFEILAPREEEARVLLYEVYQDDDAFEVHRNGPSIARFREETARMVEGLHVTKCTFVP
ncbi:antibiotic biosynthesis monooxygenase [Sphingomonas sp. JC676]|uniref:putative quinol monooxygenase n=1 Tax=Sphingomonas sp. JC676 TaxID=2768065 RepID=UPI001657D5E4|nr:antibiotic biosynthesis monooxygenase [Sphingomonas sp. JC676]MBC9032161.1 antibiotic biosynthesis monooxygenase [Sphingomonas sp. JC676]